MKNDLNKIFTKLSNQDLKTAIREIVEDKEIGQIRDSGFVKKIARQIDSQLDSGDYIRFLFLVETNILLEGAKRFSTLM